MTTDKIKWKNPPSRRPPGRPPGRWMTLLLPLVENPKRWALVYTAPSHPAAASCASNLRRRRIYRPDGVWEFQSSGLEVYARYMGEE